MNMFLFMMFVIIAMVSAETDIEKAREICKNVPQAKLEEITNKCVANMLN